MSTSNSVLNMILDDSDSDEELEMLAIIVLEEERLNQESQPRRRGSIQGHAVIDRDRVEGHNILFWQYFADPPTFPPKYLRRRFRMNRSLFPPTSPRGRKEVHFSKAQESARKDVERAFGVLQARFAIVRGPARFWRRETLKDIMKACIILHNMIIEDERELVGLDYDYDTTDKSPPPATVSHERTTELCEFIQMHCRIRDRETHSQLLVDLVEHLWELHVDS